MMLLRNFTFLDMEFSRSKNYKAVVKYLRKTWQKSLHDSNLIWFAEEHLYTKELRDLRRFLERSGVLRNNSFGMNGFEAVTLIMDLQSVWGKI